MQFEPVDSARNLDLKLTGAPERFPVGFHAPTGSDQLAYGAGQFFRGELPHWFTIITRVLNFETELLQLRRRRLLRLAIAFQKPAVLGIVEARRRIRGGNLPVLIKKRQLRS